MPKVSDAQLEVAKELIVKRAQREGLNPDEYVKTHFAGIESGEMLISKEALYQSIQSFKDIENTVKRESFIKLYLDAEPVPEFKAKYVYGNDTEKNLLIQKAQEFLGQYGKYDYSNPIEGKFGHKMFFAPDYRAINRIGIENAYIEYALHSLTKKGDDYNTRITDDSKIRAIPDIESVMRNADGFKEEGDRLFYYKKIREGERPYGVVLLELSKVGDKAVFEGYRFITHLPSKKESFIKRFGLPTETQLRGTAGDERAGTATTDIDNILPLSDESVKKLEQTHDKRAKGAVEFIEDGRAVIHAFEGSRYYNRGSRTWTHLQAAD